MGETRGWGQSQKNYLVANRPTATIRKPPDGRVHRLAGEWGMRKEKPFDRWSNFQFIGDEVGEAIFGGGAG